MIQSKNDKSFLYFATNSIIGIEGISMALLALRVLAGGFLVQHGISKWLNFNEMAVFFPDPFFWGSNTTLVCAIIFELGLSLFLILGCFMRLITIPLIIYFLLIIFVVHNGKIWGEAELACVYLIICLALLLSGPGNHSLDHYIQKNLIHQDVSFEDEANADA